MRNLMIEKIIPEALKALKKEEIPPRSCIITKLIDLLYHCILLDRAKVTIT